MMRKPKTLAEISAHPSVKSVSDERSIGSGIWIFLKPGFICTESGAHAVHEDTVTETIACFNSSIEPCDCGDCRG